MMMIIIMMDLVLVRLLLIMMLMMFIMVQTKLIMLIKYQIYCTQIKKYIYLVASALQSWAAVQRHRAANLLHVLVAKSPYNHGSLLISLEVLVELSL